MVKPVTFKSFLLVFPLFFVLMHSPVHAQDLEPRAYSNVPVGLNFIVANYGYTAGSVLFDPAIPLENANIRIHGVFAGYARTVKVGKMLGKIDVITPYGWLSGTADFQGQPVAREVSGFGDSRIRMTLNFVGAPAMTLAEFKDYKQNFIVGASLQVFVPLSQYDPDRLVNIGSNRFTFKPELGVSKAFGHLSVELAGGVAFYTVNNDFYNGKTREQDPIGSVQAHVNYSFKRNFWVALDGIFYWGGRTTVNGVEGNDLQENTRLGFTMAYPLGIHHSLKLHLSTGVYTRTGSDFNTVSVAWQYRWGKGFTKATAPGDPKKK